MRRPSLRVCLEERALRRMNRRSRARKHSASGAELRAGEASRLHDAPRVGYPPRRKFTVTVMTTETGVPLRRVGV